MDWVIGDQKVTVGDWVFSDFYAAPGRENDTTLKDLCIEANGIDLAAFDVGGEGSWRKAQNKAYCAALGPRFNARLWRHSFRAWVADHFEQSTWFAFKMPGRHWRYMMPSSVQSAHKVKGHIRQLVSDGLVNQVPLVVRLGMSPSEIRAAVGRAAWRKLANNSKTRNKLICDLIGQPNGDTLADLDRAISIRSTAMLAMWGDVQILQHADRISPSLSRRDVVRTCQLIQDTQRMGDYNPSWGYARLEREHEASARRIAAGEFSSKPFCKPESFTVGEYTFDRLCSQADVAAEGRAMHHCLSSYATSCQRGDYRAYKVTGPERATLGATVGRQTVQFQQLYGVCNKHVSDDCRAAAMQFLDILNERRVAA